MIVKENFKYKFGFLNLDVPNNKLYEYCPYLVYSSYLLSIILILVSVPRCSATDSETNQEFL